MNPKVNNLVFTYGRAMHDWVLISDSNIRVDRNYLRSITSGIRPDTGVITSIVSGVGATTWGGELEAVCLNTFYARGMLIAAGVGRPCAMGKSMLFKRSEASRFGGIRILALYLAEDYMAGEAMKKLGLKVQLEHRTVSQFLGRYDLSLYWSRQLRWCRIRKSQAPLPFLAEGIFGALCSGLAAATAFNLLSDYSIPIFLALHLLAWQIFDIAMISVFAPLTSLRPIAAWWVREFLAIPIWACALSGNTVQWRGHRLVLEPGGTLRP